MIRIDYYYDEENNIYLFPSQENTGFDFNSMMTGIMGIGVVGAMAGMFIPVNPEEEYRQLNKRIGTLSFALESRRDSTTGLRQHIYGSDGLLHRYGYQYVPPLVELNKHKDLRASLLNLETNEKELARMETSMTLLQKRRKELAQKLGYKEYEAEPRPHYTAMKKFTPPPGIGD